MARLLPPPLAIRLLRVMFKILDALAYGPGFWTGSTTPVNASNIAIFSRETSNPIDATASRSPHPRLLPIAVAPTRPTSLFLCAPVCIYVIEYISRWLVRSFYLPFLPFHLALPYPPSSRALLPRDPDGNPDRIRVICEDILPRSESTE